MIADAAVVLAAAGLGIAVTLGSLPVIRPLGGLTPALEVALACCLAARRRAPVTVAWVIAIAAVAIQFVELAAPGTLVPQNATPGRIPWLPAAAPFAVYSAALAGDSRIAWMPVVVLAVVGIHPWQASMTAMLQSFMLVALPVLAGLYISARRRYLSSAVERAERAEREQQLLAEQARAEERARLAAEMHDVVAHRVSLMVLQAGALGTRDLDEKARAATERVRVTGRQALEELRDVIGLLRGKPPDTAWPEDRA